MYYTVQLLNRPTPSIQNHIYVTIMLPVHTNSLSLVLVSTLLRKNVLLCNLLIHSIHTRINSVTLIDTQPNAGYSLNSSITIFILFDVYLCGMTNWRWFMNNILCSYYSIDYTRSSVKLLVSIVCSIIV